jgi:sugar/nucleoside kinase (ribokinase family)
MEQHPIQGAPEFVKQDVAMERTPPGVLCCGNIVYDTLVKPVNELHWGRGTTFVESIEYHAGGNGANTSRALAILGIPVRLLGAVGSDEAGRFLLRALQDSGADTTRVTEVSAPTAATVALVNSAGDRKFFHRPGSSCEAFPEPIDFTPELCDRMSHFHLASFFVLPRLRARGPEMLIRAREAGLTTSFDTNWDPQEGWMATLQPCLPHIDILFMNEDEAHMMTGCSDHTAAANTVMAKGLRTAVMKLSGRGCAIYDNEREIVCAAFDVEAKDTTGAGDCFVAGFLAARQRGASLAEAGQFANAVAAMSVQTIGAVEGVLPLTQTEAWIRSTPLRGQVPSNI